MAHEGQRVVVAFLDLSLFLAFFCFSAAAATEYVIGLDDIELFIDGSK